MPIAERGVYTVSRVYEYTARVCAVSGRVPRLSTHYGFMRFFHISKPVSKQKVRELRLVPASARLCTVQ